MAVQLDVSQPLLLGPGEGETVTDRREREVRTLCDHELVDIAWSRYSPGERGPDPHVHWEHADAFYILDGEIVFDLGPKPEKVNAPAGTLVLVPQGVIHSFGNESDADARYLNIHAPSGGFADSLRGNREGFDSHDPPEDGGRSASDAVIRGPGEGDALAVGASGVIFKAEVGDGEGTFSLSEIKLAPGFPGPVPHTHERHLDSFFVLEGILALQLGDNTVEAPAGSFGVVPPGNVHTFSNPSEGTVRALNLMAPGGFEQYLKEVGRLGTSDPAEMAKIASRYDFRPVG